jgi:hypothetical protein
MYIILQIVGIKRTVFMLRIMEILGSNLTPEVSFLDSGFQWFSSVPKAYATIVSIHILPNLLSLLSKYSTI